MSWLDRLFKKGSQLVGGRDQVPRSGIGTTEKTLGETAFRATESAPTQSAHLAVTPILPSFKEGATIANTYTIRRLLGAGAMGAVYLARHKEWNLDVALKVPKAEILALPEHFRRIAQEAEVWTNLGLHPHIAYCYYTHIVDNVPLVVVEYLGGGNLRGWITDGKCADLRIGLDLAIQFCHGIEYAHARRLVHRDIKPENILLAEDGTLKVTDFGISLFAGSAGLDVDNPRSGSKSGSTVGSIGTYEYMPPEQFDSAHEVDGRADIFAFGVCLYEMFCGQRPYAIAAGERREAPDPRLLRADNVLPARLSDLMRQCVDWTKTARPSDAAIVRKELASIYFELYGSQSPWAGVPSISPDADGCNNRGVSYQVLGKPNDSESAWHEALAVNPLHLEANYNLGVARWGRGEITDSMLVNSLENVVADQGTSPRASYILALVHADRDDSATSRQMLENARALFGSADVAELENALLKRPAGGQCWRVLVGHEKPVTSLYVGPSARRVASTGFLEGGIRFWDTAPGTGTLKGKRAELLSGAIISSAGPFGLHGVDDSLYLYNLDSGEIAAVLSAKLALDKSDFNARSVHAAAVSSNARCVAYALNWMATPFMPLRIWDVTSGSVRRLEGHQEGVTSVALTGDGGWALTGSDDTTARLWDVHSGQCGRVFEGHEQSVLSVAFVNDSSEVLTASFDQTIRLWDSRTGRCVRAFRGHLRGVNAIAVINRGAIMASGSDDGTVRIWDITTGRCIRTLESEGAKVMAVKFSPDGDFLASGHDDNKIRVWRTPRIGDSVCKPLLCPPHGYQQLTTLEVHAQGLLQGVEQTMQTGDIGSAIAKLREARSLPGYSKDPRCVKRAQQLSLVSRRVALRGVWPRKVLLGHAGWVSFVRFSPNGDRILSASFDKTVRLWDVPTGRCLKVLEGHSDAVTSVQFCTEQTAISTSKDGRIRFWDLTTGNCTRVIEQSCSIGVACVDRSGSFLITGGDDGQVMVWATSTRSCLRRMTAHKEESYTKRKMVNSVCFTSDESKFITAGCDGTWKLWHFPTGQLMRTFTGHEGLINSVALTGDGRLALSAGYDHTVRLWALQTGKELMNLQDHANAVSAVAISRNGEWGLSASHDHTIRLWNLKEGRCTRVFETNTQIIWDISWSADECSAVSAGADTGISVWELDWNLEPYGNSEPHEGLRSHLAAFLRAHQPYGVALPVGQRPTRQVLSSALSRANRPVWSEEELPELAGSLGAAGYGWLPRERVREQLERLVSENAFLDDDLDAVFIDAFEHSARGRYESSAACYERCLRIIDAGAGGLSEEELTTKFRGVAFHLAEVYDKLGKFQDAIELVDSGLSKSPSPYGRALGQSGRGDALWRLGRVSEAEAAFVEAIQAQSVHGRLKVAEAMTRIASEQLLKRAEALILEVLDLLGREPDSEATATAYCVRGTIAGKRGDIASAKNWFNQAVKQDATCDEAILQLELLDLDNSVEPKG